MDLVRICATAPATAADPERLPVDAGPTRVDGTRPPALRPRISSNSWGEATATDNEFQTAVTNWVNAGIFPDFATGQQPGRARAR